MPRFLFKLVAFFALQGAIAAVVVANYRIDDNAFMAAIRDKHARLEQAPSPRMLLIGGSNVGFGTDSPQIKQALGVEPVNLGIQGSLGVSYMLNEALADVRPGDIVIVSPEYEQMVRRNEDPVTLVRLFEQRPAALGDIEWDWPLVKMFLDEGHLCLREIAVNSIERMRTGKIHQPPLPYRREGFNEYGDVVIHHNMAQWTHDVRSGHLLLSDSFDQRLRQVIEKFNTFHEACQERGAKVFLFWPAIPERCFDADETKIRQIVDTVTADCTIPQLNKPEEMLYPEDDFFNTVYHLTAEGARRRTKLLIDRVSAALPTTRGDADSQHEAQP